MGNTSCTWSLMQVWTLSRTYNGRMVRCKQCLFHSDAVCRGRLNGGKVAYRYLKSIDKFHEWTVSVWLTPGGSSLLSLSLSLPPNSPNDSLLTLFVGVKIILLHELKNDEGIRLFFQETWENYVKVHNPSSFRTPRIRSDVLRGIVSRRY